jgi:S-adenosylmethionine hydrolase
MIATFTDFGIEGPYLGQVRAALQQVVPGVPVVDLFTDLPAFNVQAAAYLIPAYSQYLPADAICLCVVDPGVGSDRAAIALQADGRWYVGPDNGLLSIVARRASNVEVYNIGWRPARLSDSFHGRDLFAPVCGMLAQRKNIFAQTLSTGDWCEPDWPDDLNEVVYIDSYGNAVTGWRADCLDKDAVIDLGGITCTYRRVFAECEPGQAFWYRNANGLAEIAAAHSSAEALLNMAVGRSFSVFKM